MRINDLTQQQLTLISIDLAQLRLIADLTLAPTMPYFAEKPYPIGRCREIRDEVFTLLQAQLPHTQKPGLSLLKDLKAILYKKHGAHCGMSIFKTHLLLVLGILMLLTTP